MKKYSTLLCLLWAIWLVQACRSSTDNYTQNISHEALKTNVLRYMIQAQAPLNSQLFVRYSYKEPSGETITQYTDTLLLSKSNQAKMLVVGLLPQTEYTYQILALDEQKQLHQSASQQFTTSALPTDIDIPQFELIGNTDRHNSGYILTNGLVGPQKLRARSMVMIDRKGRVVWYESLPDTESLGGGKVDKQHFLAGLDTDPAPDSQQPKIVYYGTNGHSYKEFAVNNPNRYLHHDIIINQKGQLVGLNTDTRMYDLSFLGGKKQQPLVGDAITAFSTDGTPIWEWSVWSVFEPEKTLYRIQPERWEPVYGGDAADWFHANALFQDKDGGYLISLRNSNQIIKVNETTKKVDWILGKNGTLSIPTDAQFIGQHAITVTPKGTYLLFDNGNNGTEKADHSRILEFEVDTTTQKANLIWKYDFTPQLSTPRTGYCERLPNGNTIAACGEANQIVEITPEGKIAWQMKMNCWAARAYWVDRLY